MNIKFLKATINTVIKQVSTQHDSLVDRLEYHRHKISELHQEMERSSDEKKELKSMYDKLTAKIKELS